MAGRRRGQARSVRGLLRTGAELEWVGGRVSPPFFVTGGEEPVRLSLVLWIEVPTQLVVAQQVAAPEDADGALGRALRAALDTPLVGAPRQPGRIRVADDALAAEVREVVGSGVPIEIAATPEVDALLELMVATMPAGDEDASYLESGRVPAEAVAALFQAAHMLYGLAPWKAATDGVALRMDIPALGVEGACVAIIGQLGESLGLLIFPSLAGYEAFGRLAEQLEGGRKRFDAGTDWLALNFERGGDLPPSMRREAAQNRWPVAAASTYPRVVHFEPDGASRPLVERDVRIATACAAALSLFFAKHRALFEADEIDPVCESYFDDDDREVRVTLPYEAFPLFEIEEPPWRDDARSARPPAPRVGRNAPCQCGSGRKYKKCCLARDEGERPERGERPAGHELDEHWVRELSAWALVRFGSEARRFTRDFQSAEAAIQLAAPWSVYTFGVQGRPVVAWYLEEQGRRLAPADRAWLEAQQAVWLSVWEVRETEPGASLLLEDLLSGEVRRVREVRGSRTLVVRDAVLVRVVDHRDTSLLCGTHPRPLPPWFAANVVERARGRLRRRRAVPPERLRDTAFGRSLIRYWEDAVEEFDEHRQAPLELANTDGEPLLLTTDHFDLAPGARPAVGSLLAELDGVEAPRPGEDPPFYVFLRPGNRMHASLDDTVIGRARLSDTSLALESNSRERADALRAQVEAACGERVRYRAREHSDPLSKRAPRRAGDAKPATPPPEAQQLILEFKRRHYADWIDQPVPALGGQTPREAVRNARGRDAVNVLLKEIENHEQRAGDGAAFDVSETRRALGLA